MFGRLGAAQASQADTHGRNNVILGSLSGGVAASYGSMFGMLRAADAERWSFEDSPETGVRDYAVLAGARSRNERLFVTGAAGIAQATPLGDGTSGRSQLVPAFDLSAHADYRVGGMALTISGVLGPANIRYVAISVGAELGWFGF